MDRLQGCPRGLQKFFGKGCRHLKAWFGCYQDECGRIPVLEIPILYDKKTLHMDDPLAIVAVDEAQVGQLPACVIGKPARSSRHQQNVNKYLCVKVEDDGALKTACELILQQISSYR